MLLGVIVDCCDVVFNYFEDDYDYNYDFEDDDDPYFHCWYNDVTMTVNVSLRYEYDAAIIFYALFVIKIVLYPPGLVISILSITSSSTIVVDCESCYCGSYGDCGRYYYHYIKTIETIWNPTFSAYNDD